jgi:hypothetical protein
VEKLKPNITVPCTLCGKKYKLSDMRNHVGRHILPSVRGVSVSQKVGIEACGFCGQEGCQTQLTVLNGSKFSIASSCKYHHATMSYAHAAKFTRASPCTNVPIHCLFCPPGALGQKRTIWKYNAVCHIIAEHSNEDGTLPAFQGEMLVNIFVTSEEESALGIEKNVTEDWRKDNDIPGSDAIEEVKVSLKRDRGDSTVSSEPATKRNNYNS